MAMNDTFFIMDFILMVFICSFMFFGYSSNYLIISIFLPRIKVISLKKSLHLSKKEIIFRIFESCLCFISTQVISLGFYFALLPKKGRLIINKKNIFKKIFFLEKFDIEGFEYIILGPLSLLSFAQCCSYTMNSMVNKIFNIILQNII